jgi:methylglyoxal synthase
MMKIKLCNAETLTELKEFDLSAAIRSNGECLVGRSPELGLVLDSDDVSRHHGKFFTQDGNYYFCDLGSSNGSVVNDRLAEKNQPYILKNGDAIHIGDFVLLLEEHQQELAQTVFKAIDPWLFKPKPVEIESSTPGAEIPQSLVGSEVSNVVNPNLEEISNSSPAVINENLEEEILKLETVEATHPIDTISEAEDEETSITTEVDIIPSDRPISQVEDEETSPHSDVSILPDIQTVDRVEEVEYLTPVVQENLPSYQPISQVEDEETSPRSDVNILPDIQTVDRVEEVEYLTPVVQENLPSYQPISQVEDEETSPRSDVNILPDIQTVEEVENLTTQVEENMSSTNTHSLTQDRVAEDTSMIEANLSIDKQIVLIAHDTKMSDLIELVNRHQNLFSKYSIVSWLSISQDFHQETGIKLSQEIPPGISGGYQKIAGLVNAGDVEAVIFLRDLLRPQAGQTNEESLLRLCNINEIMLATNIATAEAIVSHLS